MTRNTINVKTADGFDLQFKILDKLQAPESPNSDVLTDFYLEHLDVRVESKFVTKHNLIYKLAVDAYYRIEGGEREIIVVTVEGEIIVDTTKKSGAINYNGKAEYDLSKGSVTLKQNLFTDVRVTESTDQSITKPIVKIS